MNIIYNKWSCNHYLPIERKLDCKSMLTTISRYKEKEEICKQKEQCLKKMTLIQNIGGNNF